MVKKVLFTMILLLLSIGNTLAFEGSINVTKDSFDLNDYTKLRIQIEIQDEKNIDIKEIKGLDNFNILGSSEGASSSSNIVVVDGKTETKSKTINYIDLTLSPKKSGKFILGPAILSDGTITKETNSLSINIDGKKITRNDMMGNSDYDDMMQNDDIFIFYFIILLLLLIIIFLIVIYKFFPKIYLDISDKVKNNVEKHKINSNKIKEKIEVIDEEIVFPELDDENFAEKINIVLRKKIKNKYYIEQIEKKSYNEIYNILGDDMPDSENLKKIIEILNKLKYSNLDTDKSEILELVKKI